VSARFERRRQDLCFDHIVRLAKVLKVHRWTGRVADRKADCCDEAAQQSDTSPPLFDRALTRRHVVSPGQLDQALADVLWNLSLICAERV